MEEWGHWQKPISDPEAWGLPMNPTIMLIVSRNAKDVETIVARIGLPTLISLIPNIMNIVATLEAQKK